VISLTTRARPDKKKTFFEDFLFDWSWLCCEILTDF